MKLSVKMLLPAVGCLAMAQSFQWERQPQFPAAPAESKFPWPQNGPVQLPPQKTTEEPVQVLARRHGYLKSKETSEESFTWKFPENPVEEASPQRFETRPPSHAYNGVMVQCGPNSIRVEVKQDLFGIGQPIKTEDLNLGGCKATGEDANSRVVIFESELNRCGSVVTIAEDTLVYVFVLQYKPTALGNTPIVRTSEVSTSVGCHYRWEALNPNTIPFTTTKAVREPLQFSLKTMLDDWKTERPTAEYFLGDIIKLEASVSQFHHVPLRVFVDRCSTVLPDTTSYTSNAFIEFHGCLDVKVAGLNSRFMPRTRDDILQFQVEALTSLNKFNLIYITCKLKATKASAPIDALNKACSYFDGWSESSGINKACGCCSTESKCGPEVQHLLHAPGVQWEQEVSLGPISIKDRSLNRGKT
ncbi:zona pellucida sperm-binding protein 3-like [Osmerus mordax]|uniref:zona pellucida sperm-binding protein 3-like n=1 Tax=Osmerus mordax TaxID=8014 RepID=UPI00350EE82F